MRKVLNSPNGRGLVGPFANNNRVITTGNFRSAHGGGFGEAGMWTDGYDCAGGTAGTIAIRGSTELTWTDATGITVTKNGIIQATSVGINAGSTSPATEFEIDVTWDVAPTGYDEIELHYDSTTGNFSNEDGELPSASHNVINCASEGGVVFKVVVTPIDQVSTNTFLLTDGAIGFAVDWGDGNTVAYTSSASGVALAETFTILSSNPATSIHFTSDTFKEVQFESISTVTSAADMFLNQTNLTDISSTAEEPHSITDYTSMFEGCTGLKSLPAMNTGLGTTFDRMFFGCSNLTCLTEIDTTNQTSTTDMFTGCTAMVAPDATEQTALEGGDSYVNDGDCPTLEPEIGLSTTSTTSSITEPAHGAGDLLVLWLANASSAAIPPIPSGYTSVYSGSDNGGTSFASGRLCYKVGTGTPAVVTIGGNRSVCVAVSNARFGTGNGTSGRTASANFVARTPGESGGITFHFLAATTAADTQAPNQGYTELEFLTPPSMQSWYNLTIGATGGQAVPSINRTISSFTNRSYVTATLIVYPAV